jgi:hypothetical protein
VSPSEGRFRVVEAATLFVEITKLRIDLGLARL